MPLGDCFPADKKEDYIDRHLIPGQVISLDCSFTTPPKRKYLVLACREPKILCFLINSEIHPYIQKRPHLSQSQILISKSSHTFLDYDSYIDCKEVYELSFDEIKKQLLLDVNRIKESIAPETKEAIIEAVTNSKTLIEREKTWILSSLQSK